MLEKTRELIEQKKYNDLKAMLSELQAPDVADLLDELEHKEILLVFRLLPKELAAETFVHLKSDSQEMLIKNFSDSELKIVFSDLYMDDIVDIIEEMPASIVKRILAHTDSATRSTINQLLQYGDESAGSIMTTELISLRKDMTVTQAFDKIRKTGVDSETIYTCYVIEDDRKLIGALSVRTLLLADPNDIIDGIMEHNVISVKTTDDREFVANQMKKYDFVAMPVVDAENRLVGIVTIDDAFDVMEDETEEDFAIMAGIQPSDSEDTYLETPVYIHAKNRIMWLLFLMLSATVTGLIITGYQDKLLAIPILTSFIPMLMDTGGNCGSQSSTVVIRGLALGELEFKDLFRVMFKEFKISLLVGFILAVINTIRIYLMYHKTLSNAFGISLAVGVTLMVTVLVSKLVGCILPMLASKLKLDPAIMATPLITTIVDACSILIFFNVATLILHI